MGTGRAPAFSLSAADPHSSPVRPSSGVPGAPDLDLGPGDPSGQLASVRTVPLSELHLFLHSRPQHPFPLRKRAKRPRKKPGGVERKAKGRSRLRTSASAAVTAGSWCCATASPVPRPTTCPAWAWASGPSVGPQPGQPRPDHPAQPLGAGRGWGKVPGGAAWERGAPHPWVSAGKTGRGWGWGWSLPFREMTGSGVHRAAMSPREGSREALTRRQKRQS